MRPLTSLVLLAVSCFGLAVGLVIQAPSRVPGPEPVRLTRSPAGPSVPAATTKAGAASCASCHPGVVEHYRTTAHARSLSRFHPATAPETFEDAVVCNEPSNLCYEAFVRDGRLYQREFRRDEKGRIVHEMTVQADYVIGSGNATRSYLMEENGYVTEMPLTWYVEAERWDMSPGYEASNDRFSRQINLECMTCHNATPSHTRFTQNHYTDVPLGISCQRCHARADEHAAFQTAGGSGADPIVEAAAQTRERKLSTCQQCHLAGITTFTPGEDPTTYAAGDVLRTNRTVHVPKKQLTDTSWVGIDSHPIRLARSACFKESAMTCTTCHDPHRPADALSDADYNTTCRSCHQQPAEQTLCARPEATTPDIATSGNCVSCHLQQGGTSDVPHVTFTDHWIRKRPGPPRDPSAGRPSFDTPNPLPLMALRQMTALEGAPAATDTTAARAAVAYFRFYETMHRHPSYVQRTIRTGRKALQDRSGAAETRIALARALADDDSTAAAAAVMRDAARAHPDDAWVQYWHGALAEAAGQTNVAQEAYRRAVEIEPRMVEAQQGLAGVLVRTGQQRAAMDRLETLVTIDSVHVPHAWYNLGVLRTQAGDVRGARDAYQTATRLDPDLVQAHLQLGRLYFRVELFDRAETHFQNARVAAPNNASVHGSLGLLYLRTGDSTKARHHLKRVLEIDPSNANARSLLQRLEP